jgi:hypothetical protein
MRGWPEGSTNQANNHWRGIRARAGITVSEQVIDTSVVPPVIPRRWRAFLMPRRLIFDNHVKTLSHDALKFYLHLCHKSYRRLDGPVKLSLWQMERILDIKSAAAARYELKRAGLITFEVVTEQISLYEIARDVSPWESTNSCH